MKMIIYLHNFMLKTLFIQDYSPCNSDEMSAFS